MRGQLARVINKSKLGFCFKQQWSICISVNRGDIFDCSAWRVVEALCCLSPSGLFRASAAQDPYRWTPQKKQMSCISKKVRNRVIFIANLIWICRSRWTVQIICKVVRHEALMNLSLKTVLIRLFPVCVFATNKRLWLRSGVLAGNKTCETSIWLTSDIAWGCKKSTTGASINET